MAAPPVSPASPTSLMLDVGSVAASYLRYRQSLGELAVSQWGIQGFGPRELDMLVAGRGADSLWPVEHPVHQRSGAAWQVAPAIADIAYNSAFPFGYNDGPEWKGRGLTAAASAGIALRVGILSVSLRPVAFWAQNADFAVMPNGLAGALAYADPLNPTKIDRPQRFGASAYGRLDPGESTVRLDAVGVTLGVSSAAQSWGPMTEFPYVLGTNAAGIPRLFAGTSHPVDIGIGRVHGYVAYGRLSQSDYTDITGTAARRLGTEITATFTPRGLDNLELGATRFFHQPWPDSGFGWAQLRKPFEAFLKQNVSGTDSDNNSADNQLASVYARWVLPASGLEVYGEFGREDHSYDTRDAILEPDHEATLGLGLRKAWRRTDGSVLGVRAEMLDLDPSALGRHRGENSKYLHTETRQGHTQYGQLLGAGFSSDNGAGSMIALEHFLPDGAQDMASLARLVVRERDTVDGVPGAVDVQYALTASRTRRMRGVGVTWGLTGVYELNRYFVSDATNLLATVRVAW